MVALPPIDDPNGDKRFGWEAGRAVYVASDESPRPPEPRGFEVWKRFNLVARVDPSQSPGTREIVFLQTHKGAETSISMRFLVMFAEEYPEAPPPLFCQYL